ncbi:MAG: glycine/betaine ABC transporter substrate-binding protein [Thermoleophilia bacterium]|jgi:osmoprotectant transport system substrate-binding protein|nr:glycine/betaine ABC transporter substrate-binding protein [Thermoleophilia bacterium]
MTFRLRAIVAGSAGAVLMLGTVAIGNAATADVTIADKGFTESQIVTQLYAQALEARGFDVTVRSLGTSQIADQAVRRGDIDVYPEYTGTAFLTILKRSALRNPNAVYPAVRRGYAARGLTVLNQSPYNNDNRVACTRAAVNRYKLTTLSSLGRASRNITYSANPEHLTRADGLPVLQRSYGVNFKDVIQVAINQRYKPIEDGQAQCVYAFGTDPQIAKLRLVVLRDDKRIFQGTPFQNVPVVNTRWLNSLGGDRAEFITTMNRVSRLLDSTTMSRLNAEVDLNNEDAEDVAREFLQQRGLVRR